MSDEHELLHDRIHPASGRLLSASPVIKKPSQAARAWRRFFVMLFVVLAWAGTGYINPIMPFVILAGLPVLLMLATIALDP